MKLVAIDFPLNCATKKPVAKLAIATFHVMQIFNNLHYLILYKYIVFNQFIGTGLLAYH
jgi:hypothetical protein